MVSHTHVCILTGMGHYGPSVISHRGAAETKDDNDNDDNNDNNNFLHSVCLFK